MIIETVCKIKIYELNDKETNAGDSNDLTIRSHWNQPTFVTLKFSGSQSITVSGDALKIAIEKAQRPL